MSRGTCSGPRCTSIEGTNGNDYYGWDDRWLCLDCTEGRVCVNCECRDESTALGAAGCEADCTKPYCTECEEQNCKECTPGAICYKECVECKARRAKLKDDHICSECLGFKEESEQEEEEESEQEEESEEESEEDKEAQATERNDEAKATDR